MEVIKVRKNNTDRGSIPLYDYDCMNSSQLSTISICKHFHTIHPVVVEIVQSGPNWWTDGTKIPTFLKSLPIVAIIVKYTQFLIEMTNTEVQEVLWP